MPKISQRATEMPASPIRKLIPYSLEAKKRGTKVYHLNIGQPDIETPETALNALKPLLARASRSCCNKKILKFLL